MKAAFLKLIHFKYRTFLASLLGIVIFLCFIPFFFTGNMSYALGWLVGIIFSSIALFFSELGASMTLARKHSYFGVMFLFMRLIIYAGGLLIGAFGTFYFSFEFINFFFVLGGYLFIHLVFILFTYFLKEGSEHV